MREFIVTVVKRPINIGARVCDNVPGKAPPRVI